MDGLKSKSLSEPTNIEIIMRDALAENGIKFMEQYPTRSGFILDFYLPDYNIGLECDGEPFHSGKKQKGRDRFRDYILSRGGYKMIRFWGKDIMNDIQGCITQLKQFFS